MTGLERLRELSGELHSALLSEIADQIEREHAQTCEDHERQQEIILDLQRERDEALKLVRRLDKTRLSIMQVLAVVTEMEHHALGAEGAEDSPVARWAARLREAVRCSPEIKEDAEAARWVRENGGIEAVSSAFDRHLLAIKRLYRMAFPGEGKNYEFPTVDDCFTELDRRLMPPGMEWPRFEDGEKLKLGGQIPFGENLVTCELTSVGFTTEGCFLEPDYLVDDDGDYLVKVNLGERVKRPKPAPVGADGVPLKVGETVFGIDSGHELIVDGFVEDGSHGPYTVDCHLVNGGEQGYYMPNKLTHAKPEPPDSWEKWREGVLMSPCTYFSGDRAHDAGCKGCSIKESTTGVSYCREAKAQDLERRAKALAERERGER